MRIRGVAFVLPVQNSMARRYYGAPLVTKFNRIFSNETSLRMHAWVCMRMGVATLFVGVAWLLTSAGTGPGEIFFGRTLEIVSTEVV